MKKTYFMSYSYDNGFGNCVITRIRFPNGIDEVRKIQNNIQDEMDIEGVILMNIQPTRQWWQFWK